MPRTVTIVLLACMSMYALTIVLELIQSKNVKRLLLEAGAIAAVFVALNLTTGFPLIRVAFGGTPPDSDSGTKLFHAPNPLISNLH